MAAAGYCCRGASSSTAHHQLGNDIGGVFALVPGAIVLIVLVAGRTADLAPGGRSPSARLRSSPSVSRSPTTRGRATAQTHVGRFVGQVLHGGAGAEVHRKVERGAGHVRATVGTFVVAHRDRGCGRVVAADLVRAVDSLPGLRAGVIAATVTAVLGVCLNDSGIPIAAMAVVVGLSAFYGAGGRTRPSCRERGAATAGAADTPSGGADSA